MPRRCILFDLDGTLVHSLPDIAASANHVRQHFGLDAAPEEQIRAMVGDGLENMLRNALGRPADTAMDDAVTVYRAHHQEQCTRLVQPYPGVPEALARWDAAGHSMAVVTNKPERFARRILQHLELLRFFPVVVGSDTLPVRKPNPRTVEHALQLLGNTNAHPVAAMVGDSIFDMQTARNAGVQAVACRFGYGRPEDLLAAQAEHYWDAFPDGDFPDAAV